MLQLDKNVRKNWKKLFVTTQFTEEQKGDHSGHRVKKRMCFSKLYLVFEFWTF
jgi:hypothetical protein